MTFTVHEVQRLEVPAVDAEFLSGMGLEAAEDFEKLVSDSVERQLVYQQRQQTREQLLQQITATADWDIPEELLRQQTDNALRREMLEMSQAGFSREQIAARESQIRQNAVEDTRAALKQHFILDRIATEQEIDASQQEVDMELSMMAYQSGEPIRRLRARMVKSGMMENMYAQLRERKTVDYLLEQVSFEDVPHEPLVHDSQTSVSGAICGRMTSSLVDDTAAEEEGDE
jgi:trigger factor